MKPNSVSFILKTDFSTLPLTHKIKIKSLGRPTPEIYLTQTDKAADRNFTRHFSNAIYKKNNWICGCDHLNALFCFPCLLFYTEGIDKIWARSGYKDLKHLNQRIKKHETSTRHINCAIELALLGTANVATQFSSAYRQNIHQHNKQVDKNRYILKRIINCIKFCGKLDLALRGHDETPDSQNREFFRELVDFTTEIDAILKEHLKTAIVFRGSAKIIQNDILNSMLAVCHEEIKIQIKESDFMSIQCDETTDIATHRQMVLIFRYIYKGDVYERFWSFLKIHDKTADGLSERIVQEIGPLLQETPDKLIAQTYDGARVKSGTIKDVQTKIKSVYKNAHFVHCYAHQLNLILQKATSQDPKVKIFFQNLSSIPDFFTNSRYKCDILDDVVKLKLPKVATTRWKYDIRTVNTVFENRQALFDCFKELEENCEKTVTSKEAYGLRRFLEDPDFVFWLDLFHKILPHVDKLFNQFQDKNKDIARLSKDMEIFENTISSLVKDSLETEHVNVKIECIDEYVDHEVKRRRISHEDRNNRIAKEVCDTIILQLKERLSYRGHLEAAELLNTAMFAYFSQKFPMPILNFTVDFYPMLEKNKLKTELEVIYSRTDFRSIVGAVNMLSLMTQNNLGETFSETIKLLKMLITTPMSTTESERCFSTLKRIKTFLRSTMSDEEQLNALAMMSVNNSFVHNISNFDERVIEQFSLVKDRRPHFTYRH